MLQHFIIHCLLYYLSSGRLQGVKNNLKSGHGHLQEVVATGGSIVIFFLISRMFDLWKPLFCSVQVPLPRCITKSMAKLVWNRSEVCLLVEAL